MTFSGLIIAVFNIGFIVLLSVLEIREEVVLKRTLVIDIGGNSVKVLVTGATEPRKFPSGPTLTPRQMVSGVLKLTEDWHYDAVSIGYPGRVRDSRPYEEPVNLGHGWMKFDFEKAFGVPVKMMNDAAMQALGSYKGGTMMFLGLGTGLGTALVVDGTVVPMEIQHLPFRQGTYEDYLGLKGLRRLGIRKWRELFLQVVTRFINALELDDVVIGGGNVNKLDRLPPGCRAGDNALAFRGGFLLWEKEKIGKRDKALRGRAGTAKSLRTRRKTDE
jgi:polyphosphate glucokinase